MISPIPRQERNNERKHKKSPAPIGELEKMQMAVIGPVSTGPCVAYITNKGREEAQKEGR